MTQQEWLGCNAPDLMLTYLTAAASDRKLRLFACACCRRIWDLLPEGASRCAVEADHIHNLPHLLADYSGEGLRCYWGVEKRSYERCSSASDLAAFFPLWAELQQFVDHGEPVQAS